MKLLDPMYQTIYSELSQRSLDATFTSDFSLEGRFIAVEVKGKKYWYFDNAKQEGGQARRYVGPVEDPEITKRVEVFKDLKADMRARRKLVSTLVREAYLPQPDRTTGDVIEALANAGFFRLRGVLVGTVAFQCYCAILGVRLTNAVMQTLDADFAQFHSVSVAVEDSLPPVLQVIKEVDPTFREIPSQTDGRQTSQYVSRSGFKVEFLTPNTGSADFDGKPVRMPALGGASAIPLRFLDYLIHEPVRAVLMHNAGVPVVVPAPERYAIHKLIVATRRRTDHDGTAKSRKDLGQALALFEAMIQTRQHVALASAYTEAWDRGEAWQNAIRQSLSTFDNDARSMANKGLAAGLAELGDDPAKYNLADEPSTTTKV